eukprot:GEMP01054370.1.p1 GENE.GEMP01054370.1~~GEMP01054370.1.p1  ORF type:complete len:263 (-),score=59.71 GEMP01054370.1:728-1516(-)
MDPYTPSELVQLRKETNARATSHFGDDSTGNKHPEESPFLTPEEELKLINYYVMTLPDLCKDLGDEVVYVAATFLREFYVHNSVMEYPPAVILFTAILVAAKSLEIDVDEEFISRKLKMKGIEKKVPEVLAMECDMMIAIDGKLHRETPFIILEYMKSVHKVLEKNIILKVIVSDISLLHPAATVALALHLVVGGVITDERYLRVKDRVKPLAKEIIRVKPIFFSEHEVGRLNSKAKMARSLALRKKRKRMDNAAKGSMETI